MHAKRSNEISPLHRHRWPQWRGQRRFAREYLPKDAGVVHFVNADLIAAGLSPLQPELASLAGGRLCTVGTGSPRQSAGGLCLETTLSGLGYVGRLQKWKVAGYRIEMIFCDCTRRNWL